MNEMTNESNIGPNVDDGMSFYHDEYAVEVLTRIDDCGKEIWNKVGYGDIFDDLDTAKDDLEYRRNHYPTNTYRIVKRQISDWNVLEEN